MSLRSKVQYAVTLLVLLIVWPEPQAVRADTYPANRITMIVAFAPGGFADTMARLVAQGLSERLHQSVVVENHAGAGGNIAAGLVARAAPDGYTVLHDATAHSVNPSLYKSLPYDTLKDFAPVFLAVLVPNLLVVNNQVPVRTVADVIALAKAAGPGGLDWASSGNGTAQHLALELFRQMAGITLNHVPYRGGGPVLNDLISGQIKFYFSNATASTPFVQAGTIKAIAHTGSGRLVSLPDLPPVADTLPGYECYEWNGVFVPAATPPEIIGRLNQGLNAVIRDPAIVERLTALNAQLRPNTPAEFGAFVVSEIAKWGKVVRDGNIQIE